MKHYIILTEAEIECLNSDEDVKFLDKSGVETVICSERSFAKHEERWVDTNSDASNDRCELPSEHNEIKAPHWIIDDHGFGGTFYTCSECKHVMWDGLDIVDTRRPCPKCFAPLHEGETLYMKDGVIEQ